MELLWAGVGVSIHGAYIALQPNVFVFAMPETAHWYFSRRWRKLFFNRELPR